MHKMPSILLVCFIVIMILATLLNTDPISITNTKNIIKDAFSASDKYVASGLKKLPLLEQIAKDLTILTGNIKRNGVYITDNYLLPDIKNSNPQQTQRNIERIHSLMERIDTSCYFALIPTAAAIKQQELPPQLEDLFNERSFITEVYTKMSDSASTADIYSSLFSAKDQYTYYRNDLGLTALGGYYVYEALIGRLGYTPMAINQFEIRHLKDNYYGTLAEIGEYYSLSGDIISIYEPIETDKSFRIDHFNSDGSSRRYYSLFPMHLKDISTTKQVALGGLSDKIDITSTAKYQETCLVVGDYTALSFIPFMTNHYGSITFLSATGDPKIIATTDFNSYDRVVFVLSVDTILTEEVL